MMKLPESYACTHVPSFVFQTFEKCKAELLSLTCEMTNCKALMVHIYKDSMKCAKLGKDGTSNTTLMPFSRYTQWF